MAKQRKSKRRTKGAGLPGEVAALTKKHGLGMSTKEGLLLAVTSIAAAGAGAALGKHSLLPGLALTIWGVHKQNKFLTAAGLGVSVTSGYKSLTSGRATTGMEGLDAKTAITEAKDRVTNFFQNFSEKLYLPKSSPETVNGLAGEEEPVTYFVNPYSRPKELDMSAIDKIQAQIAEMGTTKTSLNSLEVEREF